MSELSRIVICRVDKDGETVEEYHYPPFDLPEWQVKSFDNLFEEIKKRAEGGVDE